MKQGYQSIDNLQGLEKDKGNKKMELLRKILYGGFVAILVALIIILSVTVNRVRNDAPKESQVTTIQIYNENVTYGTNILERISLKGKTKKIKFKN